MIGVQGSHKTKMWEGLFTSTGSIKIERFFAHNHNHIKSLIENIVRILGMRKMCVNSFVGLCKSM